MPDRLPHGFGTGELDRGDYIGDRPEDRREAADRRIRVQLRRAQDEAASLKSETAALRVAARLLGELYPNLAPEEALAQHADLLREASRREMALSRRLQELWEA